MMIIQGRGTTTIGRLIGCDARTVQRHRDYCLSPALVRLREMQHPYSIQATIVGGHERALKVADSAYEDGEYRSAVAGLREAGII